MYLKITVHFRPISSSKQDSTSSHKQYTTLKERQEYSTTKTDSDYGYSSSTRFRPIDKDESGARAIRVQNIPNGAVGRPVEFESMYIFNRFHVLMYIK